MVTAQDGAHGDRVDMMSQVLQGTLDAAVASSSVLFRHADHELLDLLSDTQSAQRAPLLAPIKLLGDEAAIPVQSREDGIFADDTGIEPEGEGIAAAEEKATAALVSRGALSAPPWTDGQR